MSNRRSTAVLSLPEPGARRDMAARAARTRAGKSALAGLATTSEGGTPTVAVPGLIVGPLGQAVMTALAEAERFDSPPVAALLGAGTDGSPVLTAEHADALAGLCAAFADCHPLLAGAAHELVRG